ncbi:MAG TPA: hypothetical protein PKJ19_15650, partial [Flavobacteriales bacterium]|nr:hypothetical protein [Flavobacteriales bacterium]
MDLKGVIADHMGHFSVYDIPNLLLVLVASVVLGHITAIWGARSNARDARRCALWAGTGALAAALVRSQLPLATLVLAAAVVVGKRDDANRGLDHLIMLLIGIGCGSGASVIVGIALVVFIPIMRWALKAPD